MHSCCSSLSVRRRAHHAFRPFFFFLGYIYEKEGEEKKEREKKKKKDGEKSTIGRGSVSLHLGGSFQHIPFNGGGGF